MKTFNRICRVQIFHAARVETTRPKWLTATWLVETHGPVIVIMIANRFSLIVTLVFVVLLSTIHSGEFDIWRLSFYWNYSFILNRLSSINRCIEFCQYETMFIQLLKEINLYVCIYIDIYIWDNKLYCLYSILISD